MSLLSNVKTLLLPQWGRVTLTSKVLTPGNVLVPFKWRKKGEFSKVADPMCAEIETAHCSGDEN